MKIKASALVVLLLASSITAPLPSAASGNEAPLAEAGLDQEVSRGTTVLLDATESRDPDGTIEGYEWSVLTPDGDATTPDCPDCPRSQFVASQVGTYEVTVTVTDDAGATSNDTLYVVVSAGTGPQVSLAGPTSPTTGEAATYTASLEAGTADLAEVRWFVDGDHVATRAVSGRSRSESLTQTFPTTADHTVTAEVYDEDGLSASDSLSVRVEAQENTSTLASQGSPTIHGPRTVLGEPPLRANYSLSLDLDPEDVTTVGWHVLDGAVDGGDTATITWSPGDHHLFAVVTYDDGSTNVAPFSDGTTDVAADPKPNASFDDVSRHGGLSGRASASDGYENLRSLAVEVDGETVAESTADPVQLRKDGGVDQLSVSFSAEEIDTGEPHNLTLVATDMRGQTTYRTRTVTPVGPPEIVRSEFVNDPVDSYHERINASRYAGHHVLEIDLNGVDPEDVVVETASKVDEAFVLNDSQFRHQREYMSQDGMIVFSSYWSGLKPGDYRISFLVKYRGNETEGRSIQNNSLLDVHRSKPELRYTVIDGGRGDYIPSWGLVVDASGSFDPDGTDIDYIWKHGARPITSDNSTGKFDSLDQAQLKIRDGFNLTTTNDEEFLNYYAPGINNSKELSEGPYKPNETVRFRADSNIYKLSKNNYEVNLGLDVPHVSGNVRSWEEAKIDNGECEKGPCDDRIRIPHNLSINDRRYRYYQGVLKIEASAFANGAYNPNIVLYNEENPDRTSRESQLPDVNVLIEGEQYWENVTINDLEYTVRKPDYEREVVSNESIRDEYLADNYSIASTDAILTYVVEHREKTRDAVYETKEESFRQRGVMRTFLSANPEWSEAGTKTTTETITEMETEWRDSRGGNGTFTGETREELVRAAQYKTERKYRYEYQVEKTGTKTVTRTKYRYVEKTGTRTVTKCNRYVGCYESTETYTYTVKEPYTYTTTETYTYYETETDTYWATGRRHLDHEYTGQSRTVQTSPPEYETQYKYRYEVERTETVYRYLVDRRVEVEPAEYEWRVHTNTTDKFAAQTMANRGSDWRIGETQSRPKWTLKRYNGTNDVVVDSFTDEGEVIETRAKIAGDLKQKYIDTSSGDVIVENMGPKETRIKRKYALTEEEVVDELSGGNDSEEGINWCEIKPQCDT